MFKKFEEVVHAMSIASVLKVDECLYSANWTAKEITETLMDSDLHVEWVGTITDGPNLEAV